MVVVVVVVLVAVLVVMLLLRLGVLVDADGGSSSSLRSAEEFGLQPLLKVGHESLYSTYCLAGTGKAGHDIALLKRMHRKGQDRQTPASKQASKQASKKERQQKASGIGKNALPSGASAAVRRQTDGFPSSAEI